MTKTTASLSAELVRAVGGVEIAVPVEAVQGCRGCGWPMAVLDDVYVDETEGCAVVSLECSDDCNIGDYYGWPVTEHEYLSVFGHELGEETGPLLEERATVGGSPGPAASRPADREAAGARP